MKNFLTIFALIFGLTLLDLYVFKGIKSLSRSLPSKTIATSIHYAFWGINITFYIIWVTFFFRTQGNTGSVDYKPIFYAFGFFILLFVPKLIFIIFQLIGDGVDWISSFSQATPNKGEQLSRGTFITYVGATAALIPFIGIGWGMAVGRYRFTVHKKTLTFSNLPPAFSGLKIVQISDLHLGSFFNNFEKVTPGIQLINDLNPDIILFTGDLVNNYAYEAEPWIQLFSKLKATTGKYAIMGNHDYGDYVKWESKEKRQQNINRVIEIHKEMGFDTLLNENRVLEKGGEEISIIGVENWGLPPFPQYGNLTQAMKGSEKTNFKLLLSHDPSHWDEEVKNKTNIDLTFSGHTHGMQFGVELGNIKWSPVKYKYPKWAGLYTEGKQHLYVNRGFGYIGFPGRVGIMPEITLIELKTTESNILVNKKTNH